MEKSAPQEYTAFFNQLHLLVQRTVALQERAERSESEDSGLLPEILAELQISLEELHVAEEELQQQNEELLTSRRMVEQERQRYHDLFEFAPDAYVVTNTSGMIREANRAATDLFGVSPRAIVGKPLVLYLTHASHPAYYNLLQQVPQESGVQT